MHMRNIHYENNDAALSISLIHTHTQNMIVYPYKVCDTSVFFFCFVSGRQYIIKNRKKNLFLVIYEKKRRIRF